MMSSLNSLQGQFQSYLLTAGQAVGGIERAVVSDAKATAELRLGIYADAYRMRLEEALSHDFEALHGLIGDEEFFKLCRRYIDAHPSQHFSLRYLGLHMSEFLRTTKPYVSQGVLAELAGFEWALIDAFDAQDSIAVTVNDMAALAPEVWPGLCFQLHDSVHCLSLSWNVQAIWNALKEEQVPPAPLCSETPQVWLIWRQELTTYFRSMSPQETASLNALREGKTFAELCEGLCVWVPEEQAALTAAACLHHWVSDGIIKKALVNEGSVES